MRNIRSLDFQKNTPLILDCKYITMLAEKDFIMKKGIILAAAALMCGLAMATIKIKGIKDTKYKDGVMVVNKIPTPTDFTLRIRGTGQPILLTSGNAGYVTIKPLTKSFTVTALINGEDFITEEVTRGKKQDVFVITAGASDGGSAMLIITPYSVEEAKGMDTLKKYDL